jgi:integrase
MLLRTTPPRATFRRFLMASYAEGTLGAYQAGVKHFREWGGRIPSTGVEVARYLAAFAGKAAYTTLAQRLSALHREHLSRGFKSPVKNELVRATLRGIARVYGRKQRQMRPLLKEHLEAIVRRMRGLKGVRDAALLLVGFMGGFRCSELVALEREDVQFEKEGMLVQLRRSKTDQEGEGRQVPIPNLRGPLCPVRALQAWLDASGIQEGALFRPVNRHGQIGKKRLSSDAIGTIVKRYVKKIRLDPTGYSAHSLRAGLVTSAARAGAAAWQIKKQTGHRSDQVLAGYIRDSGKFEDNVARIIFER